MEKRKTRNTGRLGICNGKPGRRFTFQMCPETRAKLKEYCEKTDELKSLVINRAILEFVKGELNV